MYPLIREGLGRCEFGRGSCPRRGPNEASFLENRKKFSEDSNKGRLSPRLTESVSDYIFLLFPNDFHIIFSVRAKINLKEYICVV